MDLNQAFGAALQFFNPAQDYHEYTFLNEINEMIIDLENDIYDLDFGYVNDLLSFK